MSTQLSGIAPFLLRFPPTSNGPLGRHLGKPCPGWIPDQPKPPEMGVNRPRRAIEFHGNHRHRIGF
jgi:hypothetical protein